MSTSGSRGASHSPGAPGKQPSGKTTPLMGLLGPLTVLHSSKKAALRKDHTFDGSLWAMGKRNIKLQSFTLAFSASICWTSGICSSSSLAPGSQEIHLQEREQTQEQVESHSPKWAPVLLCKRRKGPYPTSVSCLPTSDLPLSLCKGTAWY